jgi:predicted nuclease of restriction endonuclease-like RecB superfamily
MLPDIIVIDRDKAIIGEIFGMNTDEYLAKRKRKIQVANNISEIYDFWKWDAYLGQELLEP